MLLYMPLTSSAMVVMTTYLAAGGHSTGLHHMITHSLVSTSSLPSCPNGVAVSVVVLLPVLWCCCQYCGATASVVVLLPVLWCCCECCGVAVSVVVLL